MPTWVWLFLCLGSVLALASFAEAEEDEEDEDIPDPEASPNNSCKKSIFNTAMGFMNATFACLNGKLRIQNVLEYGTRFYCILKCAMQESGLIGADGFIDEVGSVIYVQENIPPSIRGSGAKALQPCIALASQFRPKEYYCPSYGPFFSCVLQNMNGVLGPFLLDCFGTPQISLFFGVINALTPRSMYVPPESEAIRQSRRNSTNLNASNNRTKNQRHQRTKSPVSNVTVIKSLD